MQKKITPSRATGVAVVAVAVAFALHLSAAARSQNQGSPVEIYLPAVMSGEASQNPDKTFIATFDMETTFPLAFSDAEWDVSVHTRNTETLYGLVPMQGQHGPDCSPPPATHLVDEYEEAVYRCKNHVMTAIDDNNYAAISLTPAALLDFTDEEGIVRFDLSTARTSTRDWVDIWITPYDLNLVQPLQEWYPDLNGPPREAVLIEMIPENSFILTVFRDFQETTYTWGVPGAIHWIGYDAFLEPSAMRRDTFELRLRQDHVRFCMPDYDFCWMDIDLEEPLTWSSGIVQLSHHSYTAAKACDYDGTCGPNTWHWDNMEIYPAFPFVIRPADQRFVEPGDNRVDFDVPAPEGSHLRFSALGKNIEISFNSGLTWQAAVRQQQKADHEDHFSTYWTPAPAGIQSVLFRGDSWWGGDWHARNISIWAPGS